MNYTQLKNEVTALSHEERASLASVLLDTLDPPDYYVSDQEVERRRLEAEDDPSVMISYEELKSQLGR